MYVYTRIVFDKILKKAASMRPQKEKPKGRIGLKGVPRVEKQFCKKSYKIEYDYIIVVYNSIICNCHLN